MLKKLSVLATTAFVLLTTAVFSYAQSTVANGGEFPFFQLGLLLVGGMIIVSLKLKHDKMYLSEAIGTFALFTVLITLFTNPVIDVVKQFVM